MNTESPVFTESLRIANVTQGLYGQLGVNYTQNIRNPIPLRAAILKVIPVRVADYFTWKGRVLKVTDWAAEYIRDYLKGGPMDWYCFYTVCGGMTVEELVIALKEKGYVVNSEASVRSALREIPEVRREWIHDYAPYKEGKQMRCGRFLYHAITDIGTLHSRIVGAGESDIENLEKYLDNCPSI